MTTRLVGLKITEGSLVDKGANQDAKVMLFKRDAVIEKQQTKREEGEDFPRAAFAYAPDPERPSEWKLRLWDSLEERETAAQVGRAIAALGPGGFRGNRVQIPPEALPGVKAKVRAAWRKTHPDMTDMPMVLKSGRGDPMEPNMLQKWMTAIAKRLGLTPEDVEKMEMPRTTRQVMEHRKAMEEFYQLRSDFMNSLHSIMESPDHEEHAEMLQRSVKEFAEASEPIMARMHMDDMKKAQALLEDLDVASADVTKTHEVIKAFDPDKGSDRSPDNPLVKKDRSDGPVTLEDILKAMPEDQRKAVEAELAKRDTSVSDLKAELEKAAKGTSDEVQKRFETMQSEIAKAQDEIKKANDRAEKAEQAAAVEMEKRVSREYLEKAAAYPHAGKPEDVAAMLRKADEAGIGEQLVQSLATQHEAIEKGALFAEFGRSGTDVHGNAWARIEAKGAEIAKSANVTVEKGIARYLETADGQRDYAEYEREQKEAN